MRASIYPAVRGMASNSSSTLQIVGVSYFRNCSSTAGDISATDMIGSDERNGWGCSSCYEPPRSLHDPHNPIFFSSFADRHGPPNQYNPPGNHTKHLISLMSGVAAWTGALYRSVTRTLAYELCGVPIYIASW